MSNMAGMGSFVSGLVCALCARANMRASQNLAVTQVGPLWVCGGHVDRAFEMATDGLLGWKERAERAEAAAERVRVLARRLLASDEKEAQQDGSLILQALDGRK